MLLGIGLAGLLGTVASPPAAAQVPHAYERTVTLLEELYMYPDEVEPSSLLVHAARGVEQDISWLGVEALPDGTVTLTDMAYERELGSVRAGGWDDLPDALHRLEQAVFGAGHVSDDVDLRLSVLAGLTRGLDRYSRMLAGDRLTRFDTRLKGTLVGIGATLRIVDDQLTIIRVLGDGPAATGGLQGDDRILAIDGVSTVAMPVSEAVRRIRGEAGTEVVLTIARGPVGADGAVAAQDGDETDDTGASEDDGREETADRGAGDGTPAPQAPTAGSAAETSPEVLEIPLTRARVTLENVHHKVLDEQVGYIRIDNVSQQTVRNLRRAMTALREAGALERGLVLDLRGNTGGSMKDSAGVVDQFVAQGNLLTTAGPDGEPVRGLLARIDARDAGDEPPIPMVVLVDKRTASGAEIISGGLSAHGRAALLGQRTYGKGEVQKIYSLEEAVRFKMTVAEYYVAEGHPVAGTGLFPDVTLGGIVLGEDGARYLGFDVEREQVPWDALAPIVRETEGWRGVSDDPGDLLLEIARRAVLRAEGPTREAAAEALRAVLPEVRAEQEARLAEAYAGRDIDWSPAPGPGAPPEARVDLSVSLDPDAPLDHVVRVTVHHDGATPLHRALVQLDCETYAPWDGLVVPLGRIEPGGQATGTTTVRFRPGVLPRQDLVSAVLRADRRPAIVAGSGALQAGTTPDPALRVSARLEPVPDGDHQVAIALTNRSEQVVEGLEAHFAWPADEDLELLQRGHRLARLEGGETARFAMPVRIGPDAPSTPVLELVLRGDDHGTLGRWELTLTPGGEAVARQAPDVEIRREALAVPAGTTVTVPVVVRDDREVDELVVFHNEDKVLYRHDAARRLKAEVSFEVEAGSQALTVVATDDEGTTTRRTVRILGVPEPDEAVVTPDDGEE